VHNDAAERLNELIRSYEQSMYRENVLEQIFCADLIQCAWAQGFPPIEIARGFVDFQGYDLIVQSGPVIRHIQLKGTKGTITLHQELASKPAACCVLIRLSVSDSHSRISMQYRYFGSGPSEPLDLTGLPEAKGTPWIKTSDGMKRPLRRHHVTVSTRLFQPKRAIPMEELVPLLLGPAPKGQLRG